MASAQGMSFALLRSRDAVLPTLGQMTKKHRQARSTDTSRQLPSLLLNEARHLRRSLSVQTLPQALPLAMASRAVWIRAVSSSDVAETESNPSSGGIIADVATKGHTSELLEPSVAPKRVGKAVVITGSSKGIGLALAREFLSAGDSVLVTSRSEERVAETTEKLRGEYGEDRVYGIPSDVSNAESVASLADFAKTCFGEVDIWINNAGTNGYFYGTILDCEEECLREIVNTNLLGVMLCCRQAVKLMRSQQRTGHIFNMDGAGADGNATPRFAAYGATKRSLAQFTKSLQAELKLMHVRNVIVHNLSPGMVTTELLMSGANTSQAKFFINALAEPADDVARFLVPRVREVASSRDASSSYIRFLTQPKALSQIFRRIAFQERKGRYVSED